MAKKKPWGGRFTERTTEAAEAFTASIDYDRRLYRHDIRGSVAHCEMLARQKILTRREAGKIIKGLKEIEKEIEAGKLAFSHSLEDIHMHVESRLIEKIGSLGGKLHTGRSRNDQIALDLRLFLREEIATIYEHILDLERSLITLADDNLEAIMPGFTHLQHAQPVLFSHHLMAYVAMLDRDRGRFEGCLNRVNVMPLGTGALAGVPYPTDRSFLARMLDFPQVTENSIDSVSERDFVIEFCSAAAITMMHLSRLSEELILWSSQEFGFIELAESFCTGSSMMPQKKNPDVLELIRGKTGGVYGHLVSMLVLTKSLPLAYNRDLQEDKAPLFEVTDTLKSSLEILAGLLPQTTVHHERMREAAAEGFTNATEVADYLAEKGMPFRQAHEKAGQLVALCIKRGKKLEDLPLKDFKAASKEIAPDIYDRLSVHASVKRRLSYGGTSPDQVRKMIRTAKRKVRKRP
jgi:argininosuccinate lyase